MSLGLGIWFGGGSDVCLWIRTGRIRVRMGRCI